MVFLKILQLLVLALKFKRKHCFNNSRKSWQTILKKTARRNTPAHDPREGTVQYIKKERYFFLFIWHCSCYGNNQVVVKDNQRTVGPVSLTRVLRICWNQRLLRKRSLKILNLIKLDQGQWMTLTFDTHKASCTDFSWLHLPIFTSSTTIVSEKSIVLTFSYTKAYRTKLDLAVK